MRNLKAALPLIAALALGAACKRSPEPPKEEAASPDLAPLPPSSALVVTPLDTATTGYTNEMQAKNLSQQTAELGIQHITKHQDETDEEPPTGPPPPLSEVEKKERIEQLRTMTNQFTRLRRNIDGARDKSVSLPGSTAAVLSGRKSGGALVVEEVAAGVWAGPYGGAVEAGERVVEDAAAWTELWGRLSREPAPAVDFSKTRVAAVFAGTRPTSGYAAKLVEVLEQKDRFLVRWLEEGPGQGEEVDPGETAPFLLVSIPKDGRPVRLEKIRRK